MRFKSSLFAAAFMAVAILSLAAVPTVHALSTEAGEAYGLNDATPGSISKNTLPVVIGRVLKVMLGLVGTLFLLLMVYAGLLYMTAKGDAKKIDSAKQMILGAIIGVVIVASAYSITSFVLEAATGQAPSADQPAEGFDLANCQPKKCVFDSECQGGCYVGVCKCNMGGGQPCNSQGGLDGQCVMKEASGNTSVPAP